MSHSGSAVQLTVQNELNNIEDAVDLSHRGSHEELPQVAGAQSMLHTGNMNQLRLSGNGLNPMGMQNASAMQMTY